MTLSDNFHNLYSEIEDNPKVANDIVKLVFTAPDSAERDGLLSLMYHEGIGVPVNLEKSFELAESSVDKGGDGLGYYMLGYMCDNVETPDQADGGPRQKYDHYDAERFFEASSKLDSRWKDYAILWLGDYYLDSAKGGDPEIGVEYYESIADHNAEAAGALSDYYWGLIMPEYLEDDEWTSQLFKWTSVAVELDPEEYSYRMGWIYADGLGCEKSYEKAMHFFEEAYEYGDWRGAQAIVTMYEERLEENPDMDDDTRREITTELDQWKIREKELYEQQLTESLDELDNPIEED